MRTLQELRNVLLDIIPNIIIVTGKIEVNKANAICAATNSIINLTKLEVDYFEKQKQFEIFRDYAPDDKNDLRDFKIKFSERITYYSAQPDSYLMVSEKVVEKQTNNKFKLL